MSLAKTKQQVVEFATQADMFRALVQEAVDHRIDDDWLKRARKALAAQQMRAADGARRCPSCNSLLEETSVYCDNCGTDTPRR